jgi:hypothetical protein
MAHKYMLVVEVDELYEGHRRVRLNFPSQDDDETGIRTLKLEVASQLALEDSLAEFDAEFFDKKRGTFLPLVRLAQVSVVTFAALFLIMWIFYCSSQQFAGYSLSEHN